MLKRYNGRLCDYEQGQQYKYVVTTKEHLLTILPTQLKLTQLL